ncbi:MAG: hypothetical protein QW561_04090 [Candidatus Aenigmatarchaeota archaeon]
MRKKILVCFGFLIFFSSFVFVKEVGSWNDKVTHKDLSKFAAENSVLDISKGNYMKNLGFSAGLSEKFIWNSKAQSGLLWLQEGAELEDDSSPGFPIIPGSTTRSFNHFHNPLKPWSQAGLDDTWTGESSLLWAQDGTDQQNFPSGDWSWQKVREYYYLALTSTTETERQAYFAMTFKGLGHQMHLIQDAAQPDHVRNDAHPEDAIGLSYGIGFEKWAAASKNRDLINLLAATPLLPQVSLNVAYNNLAPITQFIDAEQYDGTNPSTALSHGIAEYTNANFFSDDTIFAAESYSTDHRHYFPYPKKSSTDIQEYINQNKLPETVIAEDGVEDLGFWISKKTDGEIVEHFVKPSYFTRPVVDLLGDNQKLYHLLFYRDEKCHEDYAKKLIPKAVGYSAALLDYFFRGTIEISLPDSGLYAQANDLYDGFSRVTIKAKNTTSGEEMTDGEIKLVIRYRLLQYPSDPFNADPSEFMRVSKTNIFFYIVAAETNGRRSIEDTPVELTFDLGENKIPYNATDITLQVVYYGKLGYEEKAVAVGYKDISEPTPVDIFNDMGIICIDQKWYIAGTPEAIAEVDVNNDGIAFGVDEWDVYPHNLEVYIRFSSEDNPQKASLLNYNFHIPLITTVQPERLSRKPAILTDYTYHYSMYLMPIPAESNDLWNHRSTVYSRSGTAIKIQTEYTYDPEICKKDIDGLPPCYNEIIPAYCRFRDQIMWWGGGLVFFNAPTPYSYCSFDGITTCPIE